MSMNKIIIALVLFANVCFSNNHIVTTTEDLTYGGKLEWLDQLKPGDLILDTKDSQGRLYFYFMNQSWPGLVDGGTIWIDGDKCGEMTEIVFRNGGQQNYDWGTRKNIKIRPIPGTQVRAKSFTCFGVLNLVIDGYSPTYPGIEALNNGKRFLSGNFGFHMKGNITGNHAYQVSVLDGGTATIKCVEAQYGFSGIRFQSAAVDQKVTLNLSNFYIHDTGDGEGLYLGMTTSGAVPKIKMYINDGVLARTACEAMQLQHLIGSDVRNITIVSADMAWLHAFQPYQDTGIQLLIDGGVNNIRNIILDGSATSSVSMFSSVESAAYTGKVCNITNILINEPRQGGHYLHNSAKYGVQWNVTDLFYRNNNHTYVITGESEPQYYTSKRWGTDQYTFRRIYYTAVDKPTFFQSPTTGITFDSIFAVSQLPSIKYVNSGFHEPMGRVMQWQESFGGYHPITFVYDADGKTRSKNSDGTYIVKYVPVEYDSGVIVLDHTDHKFYKCVVGHKANATRPGALPDKWLPLTWDSYGVRSDQEDWNPVTQQYIFPPDDYRLQENCYWRDRNMGYNTACTYDNRQSSITPNVINHSLRLTGRLSVEDIRRLARESASGN